MPQADPAAPTPAGRPRAWRRRLLALAMLVALGVVLTEAARVVFGGNFHTVIPGRVYRSAQPSPAAVERAAADHGVRTIINLRGVCDRMTWYQEQCRAAQRLALCQEDVCFSAGRLPSMTEMRRLVEVLDRCDYPVLLHCRRGADRTGLASAVVLLLQTDTPFAEAARQLGARYGHVALGRPAYLDQFFALYGEWLAAGNREHTPATFRHWVLNEYRPGPCSARLELLSPRPLKAPRGEPFALRVRAHNTGVRAWRFSPLLHAGVHCGFHVWDARDVLVAQGKAGLFDAAVPPGQSIDLTLVVPALAPPRQVAGRYRLLVDMLDEQQCWFFQTGSEPLEEEIVVPVNKHVRLAVSAVLLGVIAWKTDWGQVGDAFANLRAELWLAALALLVVTQVVSALRWRFLARALGFERPLRQLTGLYFIGMYFNLLLPTSVGGDVVRAWYLDGGSKRRLAAFVSVFLDRVSGLMVLVSMACVGLVLSPLPLPAWVAWCVWGALAAAVVGLATVPLLAGYGRNGPARRERVRAALAVMRSPRVLVGTTLASVWIQVANVALVWLVGKAIGANVPGTYYWVLVPMVSLLTMLPISVNGMGVREGATVLFLAPFGVSEGIAMTLAFLWFSVYTAASLGGGFVYLFGRFPRPVAPAEMSDEVRPEHGSVCGHPDQGRAGELDAAA